MFTLFQLLQEVEELKKKQEKLVQAAIKENEEIMQRVLSKNEERLEELKRENLYNFLCSPMSFNLEEKVVGL